MIHSEDEPCSKCGLPGPKGGLHSKECRTCRSARVRANYTPVTHRYADRVPFANPETKQHSDDLPCSKCGQSGPKYPRFRACRACTIKSLRPHMLRREYGLTPEDVVVLLVGQDYKCALCGIDITADPCVDHDRGTGRIRGLLCRQCNAALGKFGDSVEGLMRAVRYLQTALPS
jgi:hypothetical protein